MLNFSEGLLRTAEDAVHDRHFKLKSDVYANDLYVYSTKTWFDVDGSSGDFDEGEIWLKVGETEKQTVDERIPQQDNESNPEPLEEKVRVENIDFTDSDFHNFLEDQDSVYRVRKHRDGMSREWFSFANMGHFWEMFNAYVNGVERPDSYKPRRHQADAITKMFNAWDYGYDEFLVAAKMRFGKNFTTMTHVREWHKENKGDDETTRVFFTTYKPNVFDSLKEDLDNHVFFENFEYVDLKNHQKNVKYCKSLPDPKTDADVVVYMGSAQLVMTNMGDDPYQVLDGEHFDFMIADEVHYGGNTWNFNKNIIDANYFTYNKLIWMTGTPFKFARVRSFSDRNSFYFTYLQEQRLKNVDRDTWVDREPMPTFKFHMVDISEKQVEKQDRFFDEEERFRLDKLFATDDETGELENRGAVKSFFRQISPEFIKRDLSPYKMCDKHEHSMWMLPRNVDAVKAAKDVLNEMPEYDGFKVFVAAGGGKDNDGNSVIGSDDIGLVKSVIKNGNLADKTITLTCGRFKEGTTVEDWHMILMMNDGKSVEDYFQTAFRAGTPLETKEFAHVFDFNPERTVNVMFEGTEGMRQAEGREGHTEVIRELLDCAHVIDHRENGFDEVDADAIMQTYLDTTDASERVSALGNIPADRVDESMAGAIAALDESVREVAEKLNENDTDGGKKENVECSSGDGESDEEDIEAIRRAIQTALQNLVRYLLVSGKDEESVSEVLETADEEQFERHVGITVEAFEEIVPALDTERIDLQIQEFTYYQKQHDGFSYN